MRPISNPILDSLTENAIKFFKDKLKPNKIYKIPNEKEKKHIAHFYLYAQKQEKFWKYP